MNSDNKASNEQISNISQEEFLKLVKDLNASETFDVTFTNGNTHTFKELTTNQLKQLVKAIVDSPLTQAEFNNTLFEIMKESCVNKEVDFTTYNVIDRLIFCLTTRIHSLSDSFTLTTEKKTYNVKLKQVLNSVISCLRDNKEIFEDSTTTKGDITLTYGLPTLKVEEQLNKEIYKNKDINVETAEDLRKVLGEAFINEIAKSIKNAKIKDSLLDFTTQNFKTRLNVLEQLPALVMQDVITFIEKYKKEIENSLRLDENTILPIDGSLFSLR
jgi:hypothetical protein